MVAPHRFRPSDLQVLQVEAPRVRLPTFSFQPAILERKYGVVWLLTCAAHARRVLVTYRLPLSRSDITLCCTMGATMAAGKHGVLSLGLKDCMMPALPCLQSRLHRPCHPMSTQKR